MANTTAQEVKQDITDTWITTKVKADLLTEKYISGSHIEVETNQGAVSLSSDVHVSGRQMVVAAGTARKIKVVKSVTAAGLKTQRWAQVSYLPSNLSSKRTDHQSSNA